MTLLQCHYSGFPSPVKIKKDTSFFLTFTFVCLSIWTKMSKLAQTSHHPLWHNAIVSRYRHKYGNAAAIMVALRLSLAGIVANEMDDINIPPNIIPSDDDGRPGFIKQRTISSEKRRPGWTAVGQMTRTNWLPTLLFLFHPSLRVSVYLPMLRGRREEKQGFVMSA